MIYIIDNYYLDADSMNLILKQKRISKNNNVSYPVVGYYHSFEQLVAELIKLNAHDAIKHADDLADVVNVSREFGKALQTPLVENLRKAIRAYDLSLVITEKA